jgi:hypothetical protein
MEQTPPGMRKRSCLCTAISAPLPVPLRRVGLIPPRAGWIVGPSERNSRSRSVDALLNALLLTANPVLVGRSARNAVAPLRGPERKDRDKNQQRGANERACGPLYL